VDKTEIWISSSRAKKAYQQPTRQTAKNIRFGESLKKLFYGFDDLAEPAGLIENHNRYAMTAAVRIFNSKQRA
jgi:hypothetical protein